MRLPITPALSLARPLVAFLCAGMAFAAEPAATNDAGRNYGGNQAAAQEFMYPPSYEECLKTGVPVIHRKDIYREGWIDLNKNGARDPYEDPAVPINQDPITEDQWIEWARPIWYGIRETDTLQAPPKANDERHVAPLQLGVVERCVRLWSNPGETVLTPFMGIGTEAFVAVRNGRRAIGVELKPEYFDVAVRNVQNARLQGALL